MTTLCFAQIPFGNSQPNNIRYYLNRTACEITQNSLSGVNSLGDWEGIKKQRYRELVEMLGLYDNPLEGERPPLNIKKTGTVRQKGYRIEKIYYESLPSLYVPANLYIPDGIKKPVPAILYVCGHAPTQKERYQEHAQKFAKLGFVCLVIETIQFGEVRGMHRGQESYGQFHWYSRGYNAAGVETWNGIRGIDLLSQLPEVDPEKIGVTGISGGGSQSWYLPAIDQRIKAAAAVAGAGSLEGQIYHRTIDEHCDCMMPNNTYLQDFADFGALIAPRPFMIAQTNRDGYYSFESVQTLYNKIKKIYTFYEEEENLILAEGSGKHGYGETFELRKDILAFFLKELMDKDISEKEIEAFDQEILPRLSVEELRVYVDGIPEDDRTSTIQDSFVKLASPPEISNKKEFENYRTTVIDFLKKQTFHAFPKKETPLDVHLEFQDKNFGKYGREVYRFTSEKDWKLELSLKRTLPKDSLQPVLLVLRNPEEKRYASEGFVSGAGKNMNIVFFEARGIGNTGWSQQLQWHIRRASNWTGRTIASMRVYDVLRCVQVLRNTSGIDPENISIAAQGEMATVALYAALLDGNIKNLVIKNPPATQNIASSPDGTGDAIEMLNCLRITDLPQVAGLLFPNNFIAVKDLPPSYQWAEKLYTNLGTSNHWIKVEKVSEWKP
ncbi:alpha/beta hydrolase [Flexithrix dorotheae]|uniref:alpha/beta hydrolase n=1 Tax=Flexithrix dorotheae TaxID=70993 RepID=UPI0012FABFB3|nr:acetylxylan esterase [Flexithrix dorotheae]